MNYDTTAETLTNRILALIPAHPEIMEINDPYILFKIEGFSCDDLGPSLAQAMWALSHAKRRYSAARKSDG